MDTLAFGYILPTTGRIPDFHRLETCAAGRTKSPQTAYPFHLRTYTDSLYKITALLFDVFRPLILYLLLTQDCRIGGCVICFYHVNGESIILARISQTVRDVRFGLPVSADIFHIQVQNIIILFEQRLIGGT